MWSIRSRKVTFYPWGKKEGINVILWREDGRLLIFHMLKRPNLRVFIALAFIVFTIAGCGTLQNGRRWGQYAIYPMVPERISHAAYDALFDLQTLLPLSGALFFRLDHYDLRVSTWATKHHPVFGSSDNARQAYDYLSFGLGAETLITALATPNGKGPKNRVVKKTKEVGIELGAELATAGVTRLLKVTTDRTRPTGGENSFPSGHASNAFSSATLSNRNLSSIKMPEKFRMPLQWWNIFLATGVSWARVEEGAHYPSDVLAGAALGHFFSAFIYDAFIGTSEHKSWGLCVSPTKGGAIIGASFVF